MNATVHSALPGKIKIESNQEFEAPHDALDGDIDINNWRAEISVLAHDAHVDHDIKKVTREDDDSVFMSEESESYKHLSSLFHHSHIMSEIEQSIDKKINQHMI